MPLYRIRGEQKLEVVWEITADSPEEAERFVVQHHELPTDVIDTLDTEVWDDPIEIQPTPVTVKVK